MSFSMVNFCGINALGSASQLICACSVKVSFPILLNLDLLTFLEQCKTNHCCFLNGCTLFDWIYMKTFLILRAHNLCYRIMMIRATFFTHQIILIILFAFSLLGCSLQKYWYNLEYEKYNYDKNRKNIWNYNISSLFIDFSYHCTAFCKFLFKG